MADIYFAYSVHRTREAAEAALERYFANGEVCAAERPYIMRRSTHYGRVIRYCVMFPG